MHFVADLCPVTFGGTAFSPAPCEKRETGRIYKRICTVFAKRSRRTMEVAGQSDPLSNDIFPGDLNLKTDISSVQSIHVINVIVFQ